MALTRKLRASKQILIAGRRERCHAVSLNPQLNKFNQVRLQSVICSVAMGATCRMPDKIRLT